MRLRVHCASLGLDAANLLLALLELPQKALALQQQCLMLFLQSSDRREERHLMKTSQFEVFSSQECGGTWEEVGGDLIKRCGPICRHVVVAVYAVGQLFAQDAENAAERAQKLLHLTQQLRNRISHPRVLAPADDEEGGGAHLQADCGLQGAWPAIVLFPGAAAARERFEQLHLAQWKDVGPPAKMLK